MIGKLLVLPIVLVVLGYFLGLVPVGLTEALGAMMFLAGGAIMAFGALIALIVFVEGLWTRGHAQP